MTKREAVIQAVTVLATTFNREISATLIEAYQLGLDAIDADAVARATKRALAECKFMPAPAELLALVGEKRDVAALGAEAWASVRWAVDAYDYTASPDFGPLVNACIRNIGGWGRLCDMKLGELDVWARREFLRLYALFADQDPAKLDGAPFVGFLHEATFFVAIGTQNAPFNPARALAAPPSALAPVVRALADAKSQTGAEDTHPRGSTVLARPADESPGAPPPPREVKAPVAISEDEKRVAVTLIEAQLAERRAREGGAT